jgi:chromosome segregation ATPase
MSTDILHKLRKYHTKYDETSSFEKSREYRSKINYYQRKLQQGGFDKGEFTDRSLADRVDRYGEDKLQKLATAGVFKDDETGVKSYLDALEGDVKLQEKVDPTVRALNTAVGDLQRRIEARLREMEASARAKSTEYEETIRTLTEEITRKEEEIANLKRQLETTGTGKDAEIMRLRKEIKAKDNEIGDLNRRVERVQELKVQAEELNETLRTELQRTLDRLGEVDDQYQRQIAVLDTELKRITGDIDGLLSGGNYNSNTSEPASLNWDDYPTEQF